MTIISNTVDYLDQDTLLEGFFAFDDQIEGQRPVVLYSPHMKIEQTIMHR
ncbi:hypothetical protein [methane-oxidizing endosymbiont of Gigantopelta aegis]